MTQLVVSAVGAAVGFAVGGPTGAQIGWAVGGLVGGALGPAQKSQGPRLADLKATASSYGTPIAYIEGHPRVAGVIVWASSKRELATTTSSGGKGGPGAQSTTYTYEQDVLYLLSANIIAGVRRIWSNGELVYTAAEDATGSSVGASLVSDKWTGITVYKGGPTQLPDPTYEAVVGVGNAPAYRGRGTVMLRGLQLGNSGQLPNLTFEMVTTGTVSNTFVTVATATATTQQIRSPGYSFNGFDYLVYNGAGQVDQYRVTPGSLAPVYVSTAAPAGISSPADIGQSDETCMAFAYYSTGPRVRVQRFGGSFTEYTMSDTTDTFNYTSLRFAQRGNRIVFGSDTALGAAGAGGGTGKQTIYLFAKNGGQLGSALLLSRLRALAVGSGLVAAVCYDGNIYTFDSATLAVVATIAIPAGAGSGTNNWVGYTDSGVLHFAGGVTATNLYAWNGSTWSVVFDLGAKTPGASGSGSAMLGESYWCWIAPINTDIFGTAPTLTAANEALDQVVSRQCLRAGLTAGQIDVTALAGKSVRAMAVSQTSSARQVLENLASAYLFEAVEADKLKFVLRGGAPALTIPYANMGASTGGPAEPLPLHRRNDTEAPASVTVRYMNVSDDYQDGTESSDRLLTSGNGVLQAEVPLGLTPAEAKFMADVQAMDIAAGLIAVGPLALTRDYSALQPTDVVLLVDTDGSVFRARLVKCSQSGGLISFDAVLDDATVISSVVGTTTTGYTSSSTVSAAAETVMELMDIPILRDADNDAGFYAGFRGANTPWPGCALMAGLDGITYTQQDTITASTAIGTCSTTLADWLSGNVFDETNSVTVNVGLGTLVSDTRDNVLTLGNNACLIGSEVLHYRTATLVSTGVYTLSGLLRGRRGTEWAQTGHVAGERFVALQLAGLRRVAVETSAINATRHYKGVTLNRALGTAVDKPFACAAIGLKPWAPVNLRATRDPAVNDVVITWSRRTRLATSFGSGLVPLGETTEAYDVVVFTDGTFTTIKRTITAATQTATYTSAQQVTDFGSAQAVVYVRVYQLSATVGRGYVVQGGI